MKAKYLMEKIYVFFCLLLLSSCVYADGLWDTSAGRAFYSSTFGQLMFALFKLVGLCYAIKSLLLLYKYALGQQTSCGPWGCVARFVASVWIFYIAVTLNILYNTFFKIS